MEKIEKEFREMRMGNACVIQSRLMKLAEILMHEKLEPEEDEEDFEETSYDEDDDNHPARNEMFTLMELYKVLLKDFK